MKVYYHLKIFSSYRGKGNSQLNSIHLYFLGHNFITLYVQNSNSLVYFGRTIFFLECRFED